MSSLGTAFAEIKADYAAARSSRFRRRRTGLALSGGHADFHYRSEADYLRMMEEARDMDRNDLSVGGIVDRACVNTLQGGFTIDAQTPDPVLNEELEARWSEWSDDSDSCDVTGERAFADLEWLALRHMFVDGDMVALLTEEGAIELVEAHRLRTPTNTKKNVVHGVHLDSRRRRLEYWLTKDDIDPRRPLVRVGDTLPFPVRDESGERVLSHIYNPKRATQTRGVTALAPAFDTTGQLEDIFFAKLVQQQVSSCYTIFRQREAGAPPPGARGQRGAQETQTLSDGSVRTIEGIAPGMEIIGAPGETLHGFSPSVPNAEFFPHVKLMLTLVGLNLGLPLILVLMDGSETNFSGWRGAMDQAKLGFRRNQGSLSRKLHRPVWRWKVRGWASEDTALLRAWERHGALFFAHRVNCPRWPYVQPLDDAKADALRVEEYQTSPRRLQAELGGEWEEVAAEAVADRGLLIRKAIEEADSINKQFPSAAVSWREVLDRKRGGERRGADAGRRGEDAGASNGKTNGVAAHV